ncbi:MAG: hypothetical protein IJV00_08675 [Clostridia bacterium]|nr:hypothetical protein [Clostridia bacterium]
MFNFSVKAPEELGFGEALEFADRLRINNVEVPDIFWGKSFYGLNGEETEKIRDMLIESQKKIVLLETGLSPEREDEWKALFRRALTVGVGGIAFDLKENEDPEFLCLLSKNYSIPLYVKNRAGSFIEDEKRMREITEKYPQIRLIFDPYEFVCTQRHPFFHVYYESRIKDRIDFLRINDGLYKTHERVLLHSGCAEIKELASILLSRSFSGYFSFAPYLDKNDFSTYSETLRIFKDELKNM